MHNRPKLELFVSALEMALQTRRHGTGLVPHSDQSPLDSASSCRARMRMHGIVSSMSGRGTVTTTRRESFFSNLKNWCATVISTPTAARSAIFDNIEVFYNRQRRHQTLGYLSPEQFEQQRMVA